MARKNAIFKKSVVGEGVACVMTWTAIEGGRSVSCDASKIPEPTQKAVFVHGLNAKIGDAAAMQDSTTEEKLDAMQKVIDALYSGAWRGEREPSDADLIEAILELNPAFKREVVTADLKKASSAEKNLLRVHPPIKKIIDRNAAAAVKKSGVDAAAILAKFIHG